MKIAIYNGVDDLPDSYIGLFEAAEERSLFYGIDWFRHLARTTKEDGQTIQVVAVEDGSHRPRAAMVLRREQFGAGMLEARKLSGFSNFYSMTYAPIIAADESDPAECLSRLIDAAVNEPPRIDSIRLGPFDADAACFDLTKHALMLADLNYRPFFTCGNWYEPVAGMSFDDYLRSRPSQIRNTYKRRRNRLEKTGRARYVLTTGREGLEEAIADYNRVYSASWKEPEQFPEFMPGFIRLCADKDRLRLGVIYMDDIPAAAQVWLLDGDKAIIYKLAYDERFKKFSIGTILTMYLMQHVIDLDGVREIDYGSGDDPHKKGWTTRRRERWSLIAHNPRTMRGWISSISENAGRTFGWLRGSTAVAKSSA